MLYLTCTTITSVDLAHYGVSRANDWVSVGCDTSYFHETWYNLNHDQKICREQESKLHLNFNRIMPFEVFSLKIVSTLSFFQTIKDVDLCSTFRKPFNMIS